MLAPVTVPYTVESYVIWVCAIQLREPLAELVEPGHHECYIMSFGVHAADDAGHPEGEITAMIIHDNTAQPVVLTGNDAIFGC